MPSVINVIIICLSLTCLFPEILSCSSESCIIKDHSSQDLRCSDTHAASLLSALQRIYGMKSHTQSVLLLRNNEDSLPQRTECRGIHVICRGKHQLLW